MKKNEKKETEKKEKVKLELPFWKKAAFYGGLIIGATVGAIGMKYLGDSSGDAGAGDAGGDSI